MKALQLHRQFSNFPHTLCVFWVNKRFHISPSLFSFASFCIFCVTKERGKCRPRKLPWLKRFLYIYFLRQLSRREGHINPEVEVLGPEKRTTSAAVLWLWLYICDISKCLAGFLYNSLFPFLRGETPSGRDVADPLLDTANCLEICGVL